MSNLTIGGAERAARLLDDHPDFRVLRTLPPLHRLPLPYPEGKLRQAVVFDTETTTLDPQPDTSSSLIVSRRFSCF